MGPGTLLTFQRLSTNIKVLMAFPTGQARNFTLPDAPAQVQSSKPSSSLVTWPVAAATEPLSTDLAILNRPPARNGGYVICLVCNKDDPKKFRMLPILANHGAWKIDCGKAPNTLLLREKILLRSHKNEIVTTEFLRYITSKSSKNRWVYSNCVRRW